MQNRIEVLKEYQWLINKLNKANRTANEPTALKFFIKSDLATQQQFLWVTVNEERGLVMATVRGDKKYQLLDIFEFQEFGKYILSFLNDKLEDEINLTVRRAIGRLFSADE